jgi:GT2 family glycosyltransferase
MTNNFSIIIPNFNGASFLADCFSSLLIAFKKTSNSQFEIILVDNASTDNSFDVIKIFQKKIKIKVIKLTTNTGFGQAVNRGAALAKFENLVICNNDLKLESNWFEKIDQTIKKNPQASSFYGLVLNKEGTKIESEGFKFYPFGRVDNINNGKPFLKHKSILNSHPIWGAPASLIVIKKNAYQKLNGFDDRFFAYIEDVDFCYRLAKMNFLTIYQPQAISYHLGGGTSSKMGNLRAKMTLRNWLFFIKKNYSLKDIVFNFPLLFLERIKNLKYFLLSTKPQYYLKDISQVVGDLIHFDKI